MKNLKIIFLRKYKRFNLSRYTISKKNFFLMIKDKNIAVVGNAESIFNSNYGMSINNNDIIIRFNHGIIKDKTKQGYRTDIWASSLGLEESAIKNLFNNPKNYIWLTPKLEIMPKYSKLFQKKMFLYPERNWRKLSNNIEGGRPTSGAMLLDFLIDNPVYKKLNIYGFDFFKSPNLFDGKYGSKAHSFPEEEKYIMNKINKCNKAEFYK